MKVYILYFVATLLIACTSQIDHVNEAAKNALEAEKALNTGDLKLYETELTKANEHQSKIFFPPWSNDKCNSFYWKQASTSTLIDTLKFRKTISKAKSVGQPHDLINFLYANLNFSHIRELENQKEEMNSRGCTPNASGFDYSQTISKYHAALNEANLYYKAKTGRGLIEDLEGINNAEYESRRHNSWDQLSSQEKKEAADYDPAVEACLNAALSNNTASDGVPSIVYDAASLCKNGLKH